jgi:hypothetical protein
VKIKKADLPATAKDRVSIKEYLNTQAGAAFGSGQK